MFAMRNGLLAAAHAVADIGACGCTQSGSDRVALAEFIA
jgi:hypothetical protein